MDSDHVRERLLEERGRLDGLRQDMEILHAESENDSSSELSHNDQHQADVGTETFDRERDLSILEQVEAELVDVERALARLDDGTYGSCEACGKPIDDARLDALPATRFCVDDQSRAERQVRWIERG